MLQIKRHIITAMLVFGCIAGRTQPAQMFHYTTRDGLPSNSIYRTLIDKKGFLWVATENGLARFDGKKFKVFTTAQGLSDNEIIDLHIDSSNILWAIPFLKRPCYLNEKTERFENETTNPELKKLVVGNTNAVNVLRYGGLFFGNNHRQSYIVQNGKVTFYSQFSALKGGSPRRAVEYARDKLLIFCDDSIRRYENGLSAGSILLEKPLSNITIIHDTVAATAGNELIIMKITPDGNVQVAARKTYSFPIRIFCHTGKSYALISFSGNKYLADKSTLEIKDEIVAEGSVTNILEDPEGNTWLSTMSNGLVKIQPQRVFTYYNKEMATSFSALLKQSNQVLAGNTNGELFAYDGAYALRRLQVTGTKRIDAWMRKIIALPDNVFVANQFGSYLLDKTASRIIQRFEGTKNRSSKAAAYINDSMLLMGTHVMAYKYNYRRKIYTDSILKRTTALASTASGGTYIGSTDGLYKWVPNQPLVYLGARYKALTYRINSIVAGPDELMWVGLGTDSLVVLYKDAVVASIPLGRNIPGTTCKALCCNKAGQVWLGTDKGLNRINYTFEKNKLVYSNTYFSAADGLAGEQVNDISIYNDTVYAAANGGISYLPTALQLPQLDIAVITTGIVINGTEQPLADFYSLKYDQNNITINFSGVDLSGFVPLFEYSINKGPWLPTEKIELSRLAPGNYTIVIRAIQRNGTPSAREARITLNIETPFWKNGLFWLTIALLFFGIIIYFLQTRNKRKQTAAITHAETEKKLAQLEMQALMAQINPHFVFNCLNSIKGFIYDRDYRQADKYLDKFSELLRNTMDNAEASVISLEKEINYLDTYLQLEKLRFGGKFDYRITAAAGIPQQEVYVPAMLLQPYVENAIRHGVRHLQERKGNIVISAAVEGDYLRMTIEDDGVGREMAQQLKSERHIEYQSRGMMLSRRRAELYEIKEIVTDKKDETGRGTGTIIHLEIPLRLKP